MRGGCSREVPVPPQKARAASSDCEQLPANEETLIKICANCGRRGKVLHGSGSSLFGQLAVDGDADRWSGLGPAWREPAARDW